MGRTCSSCCCGGRKRNVNASPPQNPDWMADLPERLHNVPMNRIAIPGSHDSSTFDLDPSTEFGPSSGKTLQCLVNNKCTGCVARPIAYRYSVTQTFSYTQQLTAGIRYFDLRCEKRLKDSEYYFVHGMYGPKIFEAMMEINSYLEKHPKEIVLLDFNHFYSMDTADHETVVETVLKIFGGKVCPCNNHTLPLSLTLSQMWQKKCQVIIFYQIDAIVKKFPQLWPGNFIPSPWANTMSVDALLKFLDENYKKTWPGFQVCQGVLTPQTSTVALNLCGSVRTKCADKINTPYVAWLKDKKQMDNAGHRINVCILDFIETAGYIPQVLALNFTGENSQQCQSAL